MLIGTLGQLKLATILQQIEIHEKTGLLIITQGEQRIKLSVQQGQIISFEPLQGYGTLWNRLLQAGVISRHDLQVALDAVSIPYHQFTSIVNCSEVEMVLTLERLGLASYEQLYDWVRQEAIEILQVLLTWSEGETYFEEGVQPPKDRFPLALRITSLLPSLATSILSNKDFNPHIEKPSTPLTPFPIITPKLDLEEKCAPITPITVTPLPTEFNPTTLSQESVIPSSSPDVIFPLLPDSGTSKTSQPLGNTALQPNKEKREEVTRLSDASTIGTLVHRAIVPLTIGRLIDTASDDTLTAKYSTPRQSQSSVTQWEVFLIAAILLIAALVHGINMFHFPYYEQDEGTYMSQAWAVVHLGRLAYYTYIYDHAPAGWIQIAAWTVITGGFHTFGSAINSGRALMLLFQLISTLILYRIVRSISLNVSIAVIVALLFILSPYGIYFHHVVLLDNITTSWMLLSILLLVSGRLSLRRTWLSAFALAISILSKELTVFLVPAMAYLVFFRADKSHRWLATIGWVTLVISLASLYPLMAILKNEFFPSGTFLGGTAPHVSLIGTLQSQAARGKDGGLFSLSSGFWQQTKIWLQDDPILVVAGSLCAILSVLLIKKHRLVGIMGLLTLSLWAFLARGGVIIGYYLVPLLPLLALNVGLFLDLIAEGVRKLLAVFVRTRSMVGQIIAQSVIILCLAGIVIGYLGPALGSGYGSSDIGNKNDPLVFWRSMQADAQDQAIQWIEKNHLPLSSHMIIDESMWTDLYDSGYTADYYWKVAQDPAIAGGKYHYNWRNFDYIITTPEMLTDAQANHMTLVEDVLVHSTLITYFDTSGWRVEIRKVNK